METQLSLGGRAVEDLYVEHDVAVDPATGAARVRVPIPLPPGRGGHGPALALEYASSGGNSPFGMGWSLTGLPPVTVSTRRGLPRYDGSDTYALGGDELVPARERGPDGAWRPRTTDAGAHHVRFYRARLDAGVRLERWTERATGRVHWRSRDGAGTVVVYGRDPSGAGRVADPDDPARTFAWLPERAHDADGNVVRLVHAPEDAAGVDPAAPHERGRLLRGGFAQRYLKRVLWGNLRPQLPDDPDPADQHWCFQAVLDYGDHADPHRPGPDPDRAWPARPDPFSTRRPGFEVRTWRLCRRVLVFHHFDELGPGPTLVQADRLEHREDPAGSTLRALVRTGHRRGTAGAPDESRSLPPLTFAYTEPASAGAFHPAPAETEENAPHGVAGGRTRFADLDGEGLPGILTETDGAWYFKPNEGGGRFGAQRRVDERPAHPSGAFALADFDRDGRPDLVRLQGRGAGSYTRGGPGGAWEGFRPFAAVPHVEALGGRVEWVDLNGDGRADVVVAGSDRFAWYASRGRDGFAAAVEIPRPHAEGAGPTLLAEDAARDLFFADMTGDGLADQVRVRSGRVEYWPQLGNGRFGPPVLMDGAPELDAQGQFDAARLRLVDLDGSGTADLLYLGRGEVRWWTNAAGNRWVEGGRAAGLPFVDNLSSVRVLDFAGDGTPCLVWSSPGAGGAGAIRYLPLTGGVRPRLVVSVDNGMGRQTRLAYATSGAHYLRARARGTPWTTRIPSHPVVADRLEVVDQVGGARAVQRFEYHDGRWDPEEGGFAGFGRVDRFDAEAQGGPGEPPETYADPACVRTWLHPGAGAWAGPWTPGAWAGDPDEGALAPHRWDALEAWSPEECEAGLRALAGRVLREEVFAVRPDGTLAPHPFEVTRSSWALRRVQPADGEHGPAVAVHLAERVSAVYEQEPDDPRVLHHLVLEVDAHGAVLRECDVAYPRRPGRAPADPAQAALRVTVARHRVRHVDEPGRLELSLPVETEELEVSGVAAPPAGLLRSGALDAALAPALAAPLAQHEAFTAGVQARRTGWDRTFYWDAALAAALPAGEVGPRTRVHHEESACFTGPWLDATLGGRADAAALAEAGYVERDGHWWMRDPVRHCDTATGFLLPGRVERWDGAASEPEYDRYGLAQVAATDAAGNRATARVDYHLLVPWRLTDPNGAVEEARFDALGVAVAATAYGTVPAPGGGEAPYGHEPLAAWTGGPGAAVDAALADPAAAVGSAARAVCYDLASLPPRVATLAREALAHDGRGGGGGGRVAVSVAYLDGFGRTLQARTRVEPGPAVARGPDGRVLLDPDGVPVLAHADDRWVVSGHVVYGDKQQVVRQHPPFYSSTAAFEPDPELRRGPAGRTHHDAVGRPVREDHADGTHTRLEVLAWELRRHDENDTVQESLYRVLREPLPDDHPEKRALQAAQAHAGTFTSVHLDPLGREVRVVERGGDGTERVSATTLDEAGSVVSVADARGLTAWRHAYDLQGRELYAFSVDAGETRALPDAAGRPVHRWDARGAHERRHFDALDRPVRLHVDGLPGLDHRVEEWVYGDDPEVADGALRNARGRVVEQRDGAGVVSVAAYDPAGAVLASERRFRVDYRTEPDWSGPAVALEAEVHRSEAAYDALGRPVRQRLADGTERETTYLAGSGVARVVVRASDGTLADLPVLEGAEYDARGSRTRGVLGNGVVLETEHDPETFRARRLRARRPAAGATPARVYQDLAYTYDPVGNVVRALDAAQEPGSPLPVLQGLAVSSVREFRYDAFYRLREATGRVHQALLEHDWRPGLPHPGGSKGTRHLSLDNGAAVERYRRTFDYDPAGNVLRVRHLGATRGWTTEMWVSAASNRSLPRLDPSGLPVADPEACFDAAGHCVSLPHLRRMAWGWRGTLSRAVVVDRSADGLPDDAEHYGYDAAGLRVRKVHERLVDGQVEVVETRYLEGCEVRRVRRGGALLLERLTSHVHDGEGRVARVHRWTVDVHARETDDVARARVHYVVTDRSGSTTLELDEAGEVITYEEHFPYGGSAFVAGDGARGVALRDYRYAGKARDDATGLCDFGYRLYAPWMGRWLSPDPLGAVDGPNPYLYCLDNPVTFTDPDGLQATATEEQRQAVIDHVYASRHPQWYESERASRTPEQAKQLQSMRDPVVVRVNRGDEPRIYYVEKEDLPRFLSDLKAGRARLWHVDPALEGAGDGTAGGAPRGEPPPPDEPDEPAAPNPIGAESGIEIPELPLLSPAQEPADSKGTSASADPASAAPAAAGAEKPAPPGGTGGRGAGRRDGAGGGAGAGAGSPLGRAGGVEGGSLSSERGMPGGTGSAGRGRVGGTGSSAFGAVDGAPQGRVGGTSTLGPPAEASARQEGQGGSAPPLRASPRSGPDGPAAGSAGASDATAGGTAGGTGGAGGSQGGVMDTAVRWAGYANLEFGGADGARGDGLPGGMGILDVGAGTLLKLAYVGTTVAGLVTGVGEMATAIRAILKVGLRNFLKSLLRKLARLIPALREMLARAWRGIRGLASRIRSVFSWGRRAAGVIDPVVDNDMLALAFAAARLGGDSERHRIALRLLTEPRIEWVITPTTYREFMRVERGQAARRRFLKSLPNVRRLSGDEARRIATSAEFRERFAKLGVMIRNSTPQGNMHLRPWPLPDGKRAHTHYRDMVAVTFARSLSIPFVTAEKGFPTLIQNHMRSQKWRKLGLDAVNMKDFLRGLFPD